MTEERRALLADEWLIVRDSGEIPEITFHSALYYLQGDDEGPGLELTPDESHALKEAALERYHEIILRDLKVENFHKGIYRGVRRTIYNWERCRVFAARQSVSCEEFRETAARALLLFLEQGVAAAGKTLPETFINCSARELMALAEELGIEAGELPEDIGRFCVNEAEG